MLRSSLFAFGISILAAGCAASSTDDADVDQGGAAASASGGDWLQFSPKQANNPWDECEEEASGGAAVIGIGGSKPPEPESDSGATVRSCLEEKGIELSVIAFLQPGESGGGGCLSLDCPAGNSLVVRTTSAASTTAAKKLGFTAVKAKSLLTTNACKDVPFAVTSGFEQQFGSDKVIAFARKEKAAVEFAGIGFEPVAKSACGYTAVVQPKDAAASKALEAKGFAAAE